MSIAIVHSRANVGIDAPLVAVETHLSNGLPSFTIVGLPETAVRESRERVRSAILNANFQFPARRITVNLAPADLPKSGGRFDLAIAISILAASEQVPASSLHHYEILGELALTGALRAVKGVLPAVLAARDSGRTLIIPEVNRAEASLARQVSACSGAHLLDVCRYLQTGGGLVPCCFSEPSPVLAAENIEFAGIHGHENAKRALTVAAAGGHSVLLFGPPGSGKTLLANALPSLLPPLPEEQALEVAVARSISRESVDVARWREPPFRAPHHTTTGVAMVGGGALARPGEITLAHRGVLFLDELPEFQRPVLEALREPLESGVVTISRSGQRTRFPARFQLIAAMNPCPCGSSGDSGNPCRCPGSQVDRYRAKISGPLLDRMDMVLPVPRQQHREYVGATAKTGTEASSVSQSEGIRERIARCRELQKKRCGKLNSDLSIHEIDMYCVLDSDSYKFLAATVERLQLSARACHRILKVARTIADLDEHPHIQQRHLIQAIAYRRIEELFTRKAL